MSLKRGRPHYIIYASASVYSGIGRQLSRNTYLYQVIGQDQGWASRSRQVEATPSPDLDQARLRRYRNLLARKRRP